VYKRQPLFTLEDELPGLAPLFIPRRGMFCIIAGDTGSGKSFFVDWTMLKAIANKQHVLLVSLEMTPGEVYTRLIYQLTGVYATRGDISADSLKLIKQWCVAFDEYLHVSTHPEPSVTTIEAQLKAYGGDISFIVVDTISLFCKNLEWQELNALSYELKRKFAMAKIYNNPFVVAVSQMSLKGVSKNKVSTSNMFGASNIAQAPDLVLFIDTDVNAVEQTTLIKVIKRDRSAGQFGSVNVRFDFEAGNFYEVSAVGSSSDEVDF
jgi:replicative DNA helicase